MGLANRSGRKPAARRAVAALLCAALLLPFGGCVKKDEAFKKEIFAMDTVMLLTAYGKNGEAGLTAAQNIINTMDAMLAPESDGSAVYAMNNAGGETVSVPEEIGEMLTAARTVYDQSGGALDLTVYPLVKLWGFISGQYYVPTAEEISADLKKLCFGDIAISRSDDGTCSVTMPAGAEVSFGAVAKGCASDHAIAALKAAGVTSAILSLGGNVQTLGLKPDGSNWNVAIQDPDDTGGYVGIVSVGETAVITSGNYQRYFEQDGVRYHHIIDPATGAPARSGLNSATIICPSGTMADSLSTAMFVLGADKALDYWRTYGGFEMILITDDPRIICTEGLADSFTLSNDNYALSFTD
jgi:thiamine biosynthesis lipoprotein